MPVAFAFWGSDIAALTRTTIEVSGRAHHNDESASIAAIEAPTHRAPSRSSNHRRVAKRTRRQCENLRLNLLTDSASSGLGRGCVLQHADRLALQQAAPVRRASDQPR